MTYLYVLIGVLAFLAARNIIAVRRLAKEFAEAEPQGQNQQTSTNHNKP